VYSVRAAPTGTSGSRAMPHDGQAPGLFSRTSGHMGQTYAGAAAATGFGARSVVLRALAGGGEDFATAGIPSMTRFEEDGMGLFKYFPGSALNFPMQEGQQK
jgi:hypothetical protein